MTDVTQPPAYEPTQSYQLTVNGQTHDVAEGWLGESLLYVLRERLGLPGAKNACEQGECGSCSVMVGGTLVCSCLVPAATVGDQPVITVEGLGDGAGLSVVQQAFVDAGAVQCGFCTPGLVVAVTDLLARNPEPSELETQEAISGNLCRCTGYGRILDAVRVAVRRGSTSTTGGAPA